jgi:hypothetical protein
VSSVDPVRVQFKEQDCYSHVAISACHGARDDLIAPKCYPYRFFRWRNSVFPHPAAELTDGAMRQTDSRYFDFCIANHLPDHTDLIVLELDSDD